MSSKCNHKDSYGSTYLGGYCMLCGERAPTVEKQRSEQEHTLKKVTSVSDFQAIRKKWADAQEKAEDLRLLENEAFERSVPRLEEEFKKAPKSRKGIWGDFLPDGLRQTEISLVDSAGQHLDFRIGPVFGSEGVHKKPGVWIGFQRLFMSSERQGDLLISPEIWRKLSKEIELRLREHGKCAPKKSVPKKKKPSSKHPTTTCNACGKNGIPHSETSPKGHWCDCQDNKSKRNKRDTK